MRTRRESNELEQCRRPESVTLTNLIKQSRQNTANSTAAAGYSEDERRYLFLHVPKTAGSALRTIIKNNLRDAAAIENALLSTQIYTATQIDWLFASYPYRFYAGHVFRLKSALGACRGHLQLLAFVRDPVDKAISSYYHLRNRDMTRTDHPVKLHSLVDLCTYAERGGAMDSNGFDDSQLDWLVGERYAQLDTVEAAVDSGQVLLFPTEKFDCAMVLLERLFPRDFSNCAYAARVNVSAKDINRDAKAERAAAEILPWLSDDRSLHQLACANLDNLVAKAFPSDAEMHSALENFRGRCAVSAEAERDPSNLGQARLGRRIKRRIKDWIS